MAQPQIWTTPYCVPNTLRSDTEDSVLGTVLHQRAISELADMLRDVADRCGASWGVCMQIALIGLAHEDGSDYDPMPDVMVLREALADENVASVRLDRVGAPLFIAEVASASTKTNDLGEKRRAYAAVGVAEYMVFDPAGHLLREPLHAWRLVGGAYRRWQPGEDGWWQSATLEVALRPGQPFVRVRDRDGQEVAPTGLVRRHAEELTRRTQDLTQRTQDLTRQLAAAEQARETAAREAARRLAAAEQARADLEDVVRRLRDQRDARDREE